MISLRVGGAEFSGRLAGFEVSYAVEEGTSEATFDAGGEASGPLLSEGLQGAPVLFRGEGAHGLSEWFRGEVSQTEDGEPVAWGPFMLMAEAKFMAEVSYEAQDLRAAVLDICRRAGIPGGAVEVRGGEEFTLGKKARFQAFTTLKNALDSLLRSAGYVGPDRPGQKRVFEPRPRPGANARTRATFGPGDYPEGGFSVSRGRRRFFSHVLITARLPNGQRAFPPVVVPVENRTRRGAASNRPYVISDFKGDEAEALETGLRLARKLEQGTVALELSGLAQDPSLGPYDPVEVTGVEEADAGGRTPERHLVHYEAALDAALAMQANAEGRAMSLSGTAVEISRRELPRPFYVSRRRSPVLEVSS